MPQQQQTNNSSKKQTKNARRDGYRDSTGSTLLRRCMTVVSMTRVPPAAPGAEAAITAPTVARTREVFDMSGVASRRDAPPGWREDDYMCAAATARTLHTRAHAELRAAVRALREADVVADSADGARTIAVYIVTVSVTSTVDPASSALQKQHYDWDIVRETDPDVRRSVAVAARHARLENANIVDEPSCVAERGGVIALLETPPSADGLVLLFFRAAVDPLSGAPFAPPRLGCVMDFAHNHPLYNLAPGVPADETGRRGGVQLSAELAHAVGERLPFEYGCARCGRPTDGRLKCGRCRAAYYCGAECQRAHWLAPAGHREACVKRPPAAAEAAAL